MKRFGFTWPTKKSELAENNFSLKDKASHLTEGFVDCLNLMCGLLDNFSALAGCSPVYYI